MGRCVSASLMAQWRSLVATWCLFILPSAPLLAAHHSHCLPLALPIGLVESLQVGLSILYYLETAIQGSKVMFKIDSLSSTFQYWVFSVSFIYFSFLLLPSENNLHPPNLSHINMTTPWLFPRSDTGGVEKQLSGVPGFHVAGPEQGGEW